MKPFLVLTLLILLTWGCSDENTPSTNEGDGGDTDSDVDTDTDSDSDSDADSDADGDSDGDSDGDADGDSDTDTDLVDTDYNPDNDYILYNPNGTRTTYLVDMDGNTVHSWENSSNGGYAVYLLDNGNILRPSQASNTQLNGGASAGLLQEIDWNGDVVWQFEYNSADYLAHHDIEPMPNGNVLMIAWEVKSAAEAEAAGREMSSEIWPDHIIEVKPTGSQGGDIVWEWHAWDHLVQDHDSSKENFGVVAEHPELLDVNLGQIKAGPGPGGGGDWLHINGVSYNPDKDQIVISSHFMDEFYVIDHSTTTAEAAGHTGGNSGKGGDILYRWGSPENYGAPGDKAFYVIHCSWWVPSNLPGGGNILVFNNGDKRPDGSYSTIEEFILPEDGPYNYEISQGSAFGPSDPSWIYEASPNTSFFSNHLGGLQRLPSGNTFIVESTSANMFEVTPDGTIVWEYKANGNQVARALRYQPDHPGLSNLK